MWPKGVNGGRKQLKVAKSFWPKPKWAKVAKSGQKGQKRPNKENNGQKRTTVLQSRSMHLKSDQKTLKTMQGVQMITA